VPSTTIQASLPRWQITYALQSIESPRSGAGKRHFSTQLQQWQLVYQSRSGPPGQPWLGPDIAEAIKEVAGKAKDAVVVPVGFISDHMEVVYDLDTEAAGLAAELGLNMVRASTVGTHPAFISMIAELIAERTGEAAERRSLGDLGAPADLCPPDCCPYRAPSIARP
jgi:ferrochelatase